MILLVLSDGKKGHFNQALSLAKLISEAVLKDAPPALLQEEPQIRAVTIEYKSELDEPFLRGVLSTIGRLISAADANHLLRAALKEESFIELSGAVEGDRVLLIITAGTSSATVGLLVGRVTKSPTCSVMFPWAPLRRLFDSIVLYPHDRSIKHPCAVRADLVPYYLEEEAVDASVSELHRRAGSPISEAISLLIGGPSRWVAFDSEQVLRRAEETVEIGETNSLPVMLTTSRRTPSELENRLAELARVKPKIVKCLVKGTVDDYNPLPAMCRLSRAIIVTADSISMLSEIIQMGRIPIALVPVMRGDKSKVTRFINHLKERNLVVASPLEEKLDGRIVSWGGGRVQEFEDGRRVASLLAQELFTPDRSRLRHTE